MALATLGEFDVFSRPPLQCGVEREMITLHRPWTTISPHAPISFIITTNELEYLKLSDISLRVQVKFSLVNKKATPTAAETTAFDARFTPVQNFMHSMWKSVELEINNKLVTNSAQNYMFKSYFETFVSMSDNAKDSYLSSIGWGTSTSRKTWLGNNKTVEFMGRLAFDLASQPRSILGGSQLKITVIPQSNWNTCIIDTSPAADDVTFNVEIVDAELLVKKSIVNPKLREAHIQALKINPAIYPHTRNEVKIFSIPSGMSNVMLDNIQLGATPARAIVALLPHNTLNGNRTDMFKFAHHDLNYLCFFMDGLAHPSIPLQPDFAKSEYMREYLSLFEAFNDMDSNPSLKINRFNYKDSNCMYAFNFLPDSSDGAVGSGYVNIPKAGAMRLDLRFAKALTENMAVVVFFQYDSMIRINEDFTVLTDYN